MNIHLRHDCSLLSSSHSFDCATRTLIWMWAFFCLIVATNDVWAQAEDGVPSDCRIGGYAGGVLERGTLVTLELSCANGTQPIECIWTISHIPVSSRCTFETSPTATTTYVAIPSNVIGEGTPVSVTVMVLPWNEGPPVACFITQTPNTTASPVPLGTLVSLSTTCSTGLPMSCLWTFTGATVRTESGSCFLLFRVTELRTQARVTATTILGNPPTVFSTVFGVAPLPPVDIPTLCHWTLALLAVMLGLSSSRSLKRRMS